jgi:N-acetylglutamate synthase-like GNAT family acetyltransferase
LILFTFNNLKPQKVELVNQVEILPYSPAYNSAFKTINQAWVESLFSLEPFDIAQFERPEETIVKTGGTIIFAKLGEEVVGTVALYKSGEHTFEMIKMGVDPKAQGRGVGLLLGQSIIAKAREMGGKKLILYSNSKLKAALHIYEKLGFKSVIPESGKYCRCDVKMEMDL